MGAAAEPDTKFEGAAYRVEGRRAYCSASTGGPWDPSLQHGGAPAALVTWLIESLPSKVPMQLSRLTINLLRPVPIAALDITVEILREGRKAQAVSVKLSAGGGMLYTRPG